MNMESRILAALQTPLAYPQLEAIIYPDGRPFGLGGSIPLGLTLERMKNRKVVHYLRSHSVKLGVSEESTTGMTWPVYSAHPIPLNFKSPRRNELRANP